MDSRDSCARPEAVFIELGEPDELDEPVEPDEPDESDEPEEPDESSVEGFRFHKSD